MCREALSATLELAVAGVRVAMPGGVAAGRGRPTSVAPAAERLSESAIPGWGQVVTNSLTERGGWKVFARDRGNRRLSTAVLGKWHHGGGGGVYS